MLSMERGGGETFDMEIARHMKNMGHDITFLSGIPLTGRIPVAMDESQVCKTDDADDWDCLHSGKQSVIRHYAVRSPWLGWVPWDSFRGGWRIRMFDFYCFEMLAARWAKHRDGAFDIIQLCELPTFVCVWKRWEMNTPVVMRLTAGNFFDPKDALTKADGIIASGMTIPQLHKGPRMDAVDIPNAVDSRLFRPQGSSFREKIGCAESDFLILYVARFQAFKNHHFLLGAFQEILAWHRKVRLILVGSGPLKHRCELQAAGAGLSERVHFLGEVPFAQLPSVYAACDLKVITSTFESFCFAALEAMATGLPIVTTNCGWVPTLIQAPRGGLVVRQNALREFVGAVRTLMENPELRDEMGCHNRALVAEQYQWGQSAKKLLKLYGTLKK